MNIPPKSSLNLLKLYHEGTHVLNFDWLKEDLFPPNNLNFEFSSKESKKPVQYGGNILLLWKF